MRINFCKLILAGVILSSTVLAGPNTHHRAHMPYTVSSKGAVVDINRASANQLSSIKGLGLKRANAIIEYRKAHGPFMSVDDLTLVKGVGQKMLLRIKKNNPGRLRIGR
jgi:competence protein ComEA helix-hairpin-helix repeat region